MRVLVLCGGESGERIVSLASGDAVARWVVEAGHEVAKYDPERPETLWGAEVRLAPEEIGMVAPAPRKYGEFNPAAVTGLLGAIEEFKPDIVFPILHGGYGEDGTVQAVLEWVGMPYTGSAPMACALAMNKEFARTLFRSARIPVTEGFTVERARLRNVAAVQDEIESRFGYPCVVKPLCGGSTIGLSKVNQASELSRALRAIENLGDAALIEAHFVGREVAATVIDQEAYPLVEIMPHEGFYDYANKYTAGRTDYYCPAPISEDESRRIQRAAVEAFCALGCSGFARVDFLLNSAGQFVCLEVNTLPGMTTHSLVPKAARARGIEPPDLIQMIINCALSRASRR